MTNGHPHIPPPEFDPRHVEALRNIAEQNHRNALGQSRGLGHVVLLLWRAVSWPVRFVLRHRRTADGDEESTVS